jgi:hypothetical protein
VLILILISLLTLAALTGLFWAGTVFVQSYFYGEPTGDLHWRAPAAAAAVTLWLVLWTVMDCAGGGHVQGPFTASVYDAKRYEELKVLVKDGKKEKEEVYKQVGAAGRVLDFRLDGKPSGPKIPSRPEKVTVKEGDAEIVFLPERDAQGHFKTEQGQSLRYLDARGRVMLEGFPGETSVFRWDWLFLHLLMYFGLLAAWFGGLWLLLRFQWTHALGGAFVFWLASLLIVVPTLLNYAEQVAGVPK